MTYLIYEYIDGCGDIRRMLFETAWKEGDDTEVLSNQAYDLGMMLNAVTPVRLILLNKPTIQVLLGEY